MGLATLKTIFKREQLSGVLLLACTLIALLWINSPYRASYDALNHWVIANRSLQHWVNDALMPLFFLLVALEIKRELITGELNTLSKAMMPVFCAVAGMLVPAGIYLLVNATHPQQWGGWAIPSATDIAFALGILSLLGNRVPRALFIFLSALAIIDDLGAILIIATFYSQTLSWVYLLSGFICLLILIFFNRLGIQKLRPYLAVGFILWYCLLHSGIHPTIAGVLVGMTIPLRSKTNHSPLKTVEHRLHAPVSYFIIPLFVLLNAGISLRGISLSETALSTVTCGVFFGLVVGKCVGIFGAVALMVKRNWVKLPQGITLLHYLPISLLAGIGFTMSIFISELAFPTQAQWLMEAKLGILCGSLISAVLGYGIFRWIGKITVHRDL